MRKRRKRRDCTSSWTLDEIEQTFVCGETNYFFRQKIMTETQDTFVQSLNLRHLLAEKQLSRLPRGGAVIYLRPVSQKKIQKRASVWLEGGRAALKRGVSCRRRRSAAGAAAGATRRHQ